MENTTKKYKETFFSRNFGLLEPFADSDSLYDGCLCPSNQAQILYWASYFGLATGLVGIYYNYRLLGLGTMIGSFIAQMYWLKPSFGWRRNLDIFWIQVLIWLHLYKAIYSPSVILYCGIQAFGVLCYAISWWFHKIGVSWGATIFHILLHFCAQSSLLVLYTS